MYIQLIPKSHFSHIVSRALKLREEGLDMPPRQIPPMMGQRGLYGRNPYMIYRPQMGQHMSARNLRRRGGFGMNQARRGGFGANLSGSGSGGLLSRINGQPGQGNPGRSGGLLSKLFRGGARGANAVTGFEGAARGGGLLQTASQPGGIMNILNQTQSVIQAVSQIQPVIEQYGPLVRNLPAMWKLYRSLKSDNDDSNDQDTNDQNTAKAEESEESKQKQIKQKKQKNTSIKKAKKKTSSSKGSNKGHRPKLYV